MNPMMPPPVPACHGLADCTVMGAASASMNIDSWRSSERTKFIMMAVLRDVEVGRVKKMWFGFGEFCAALLPCI
jgi:hypothetical protein